MSNTLEEKMTKAETALDLLMGRRIRFADAAQSFVLAIACLIGGVRTLDNRQQDIEKRLHALESRR